MAGWDQGQVYISDPLNQGDEPPTFQALAGDSFKKFVREFRDGNTFTYRDQLRRHYHLEKYLLEVQLEDLTAFNERLGEAISKKPAIYLPIFEKAATDIAAVVLNEVDLVKVHHIQIVIKSQAHALLLRNLGSSHISQLVKVQGIVISASSTRAKAVALKLRCRQCSTKLGDLIPVNSGLGGAVLPRRCQSCVEAKTADSNKPSSLDPYDIVPDECKCVDQQTLKLQESPENVPTGEMPRHMIMTCDRALTNIVVPGTRCSIVGIYDTVQHARMRGGGNAIRTPYIRVLGVHVDTAGPGRSMNTFTPEEEEELLALSRSPDIYDRLANSIAPSIYGSLNFKKAIACLLFGGSTKHLQDGMRLRGDINVLLLGDPGTAKSQLLKFAEKVAPIGVYTSGKGSSAAGLTASVVRDSGSREFYLEGGAMVLADGGVVCIDEFDKMREADRVAIHEAMEQQTISVAKAGITTTLNSRTSVLAAANSVFGRWDDSKEAGENIEFASTILSRFDLIFVVKDEYNEERDKLLAQHVMNTHFNTTSSEADAVKEGEIPLSLMKRYISYCRSKCGPRLSAASGEKLKSTFVSIRGETHAREIRDQKRSTIPITVRQLEALIRLSESLAKMQLQHFASEEHVDEAMRLFKVSTLDASNSTTSSDGGDGGGDSKDGQHEELMKVETKIKQRFPVGHKASEATLLSTFKRENFSESAIKRVIHLMLRRGELEHQKQRKLLYRIK